MILRIVKMHFLEGEEPRFLEIYEEIQIKIRAFDGCQQLSLVRDREDPSIFFTVSQWDSEEALANYRKSDMFHETWQKTRALFASKAEAWSTDVVARLD